jgi:uncharacterized protein (TIGR02231 family)
MKNKFWMVGAIIFHAFSAGAQTEKPIESRITDVTVFLAKAQITREAKTRVDVGKSSLVLTGLTSLLDPASVQVAGKGSFTILGISHRQNYLSDLNMPKGMKMLKDSVEYYQRQLALEQGQKEILNREEQLILSNQKIGGANQNVSVAELKAMADFFRSRLGEIAAAKMKQDEKVKKINERVSKLQRQINEQNEIYTRNTSELVINVSSETGGTADLEVNYVVSNAGWNPIYDLRAVNTKSPVQLNYRANVFQGTGEDWKNVRLKLSTANPNESGLKPELYTWYLDFYQPVMYQTYRSKENRGEAMPAAAQMDKLAEVSEEANAETVADFVNTIQTTLNTEFDISIPYTITSASKPTVVDIRNYEMKAAYEYSVAPKLDADAFLMAKATGWEEFSLLPGEANIFFEGTFVGKTFVDPNNIKDTLSVSLGRDKRIVVIREKLKDLTSRKFIGANQKESYAWEISVRNTKTDVIKIVVEDHLPISKNTQIEITTVDTGGAKTDVNTGKLTWQFSIPPNETRKVIYKYDVKYPKDRQVSGL